MAAKTKIVFIINPIAGTRKAPHLEDLAIRLLDDKWKPQFIRTDYAGHATQIVKNKLKKGAKFFIAVGGDGTVNEVASALVGSKANMGIVPCGSGNGLARSLKIPLKTDKALQCISQGFTRQIDAGQINGNYFFCTCGVGFDAKIGKKFSKTKTRGFHNYIKTTLREYLTYQPKKYTLKVDGEKIRTRAFLITIANAGQYGNNAYIAPNALIDDGKLEVCILKPFPHRHSFGLGMKLFTRNMDKSKYLDIQSCKSLVFCKKKMFNFHIDGDPIKLVGPIRIEVIPKSLNVITPMPKGKQAEATN
ncbi:MAG: diacylglycerol kinase family lipid kinase [Bacteroidota bacterium]|nr:MAG: diacylglycerol kinase family lipid kinase [Bacteroidota bacterium]